MLCNSLIHIFVISFTVDSRYFVNNRNIDISYQIHRSIFFLDIENFEFVNYGCTNYHSSLIADSWPVLLILSVGGGLVSLIVIGSICYYLKTKKKKKTYAFGINKKNTRYFTVSSHSLNNASRTTFRLINSFYFCKTWEKRTRTYFYFKRMVRKVMVTNNDSL